MDIKNTRFVFLFFLLPIIISCSSVTENQGMNEIAATWGSASMTKGYSASTSEGNNKYVTFKLTNPDFFGQGVDKDDIAGGIAYIFYKNLTEKERAELSKYTVVFDNGAGKEAKFDYSAQQVALYFEKESYANEYMTRLLQGDFEIISKNLESEYMSVDSLKKGFAPIAAELKSFKMISCNKIKIELYNFKDRQKVKGIKYSGNVIFKNDSLPKHYSISLELDKQNQSDIISFNYW